MTVYAGWLDDNWLYRQKITINNAGAANSDKKILFDVDTRYAAGQAKEGKIQTDCGDVRFTDINGRVLQYYFTGTCNNASSDFYVFVPTINTGTTILYMYYGNPSALNGTRGSQFTQATFTPTSYTYGSEETNTVPVSYWKFDEGTGAIAHDTMQSANDLGVYGAAIEHQINIMNQEFYTLSSTPVPTDNSLGLVHWDNSKYQNSKTYLEVVIKGSASPSAVATVALYSASGTKVTNSEIVSNTNGAYLRIRSSQLYLTDNTDYTVRISNVTVSGIEVYIKSAKLIVMQADATKLTTSQEQVEVGSSDGTSSTTHEAATNKKLYYYDETKFTPAPTAYFEASFKPSQPSIEQQLGILDQEFYTLSNTPVPTDNSLGLIRWDSAKFTGATVYFEAVLKGSGSPVAQATATLYTSDGTAVTDSELSTTSAAYTRMRSGALTLTDGTDYTVRLTNSNTTGIETYMLAARLIVVQSDATRLTNIQTQIELGDADGSSSTTHASLTNKKLYYYDSSKFTPTPTAYFEATFRPSTPMVTHQINIVDQLYTTTSSTALPTDDSLGVINWDATKYTGATVYFEAVLKGAGSPYTIATAYLYKVSDDSVVDGSAVADTVGANYVSARSNALTLESGDYTVRFSSSNGTTTASLKAARLVVVQTDATRLSATSTQIEMGANETSTQTAYTQLTNKKLYRYDSTKFSPAPTAYFEATLSNNTAGQVAYAALYTDGATCSSVVAGSEVTVTGTTWARVRSSAITLVSGTDYMVCIKAGANTARIANAKIVLDQADAGGVTALELTHDYANTLLTDADTGYTQQNMRNKFNPLDFGVKPAVYHEATMKTSAGTAYTEVYDPTIGSTSAPIDGSEITTVNTSYTRVRSSANILSPTSITVINPSGEQDLDIAIRNSAANTTSVAGSRLIIQLSDLPTSGPTGAVQLYNLTDTAAVSGSEVTSTTAGFTRVRSNAITLTTAKEYEVQIKSAYIANAKLVLEQSDAGGITNVELVHDYINALAIDKDLGYSSQFTYNDFYPNNFGVKPAIYFEATMKASAGTAYIKMIDFYKNTTITNTEITTSSTTYTRVRTATNINTYVDSNALQPSGDQDLDVQMHNSATNTTAVSTARIVLQFANLPTSGPTGAVQLYNTTDQTAVAGSEVTSTATGYTTVRSSAITLTTAKNYEMQMKSATVVDAKILLNQASSTGITATEVIHSVSNNITSTTSSTYQKQLDYHTYYDPTAFAGGTIAYFFESSMRITAGTGYTQAHNDSTSTAITGTEVTTTSATFARTRSADIKANLPTLATELNIQIRAGTNGQTVAVAGTNLIIQIANLSADTANSNTWISPDNCVSGKCIKIGGASQKFFRTYDSDIELNPGTASFTVSAWIKTPSGTGSTETILSRFSASGYKVYLNTSANLCFGIDDDATSFPEDFACTTTTYADNTWHFINLVKTGTSTLTVYVDGVQQAQSAIASAVGSISGTSPYLYIGADSDGVSNPWDGFIDELKYYNYAKTEPQINLEMQARNIEDSASAVYSTSQIGMNSEIIFSQGLVGRWTMDEATGATVYDKTGNGNNATSANFPTWGNGRYGSGLAFNGTTQNITFGSPTLLDNLPSAAFTASTWINMAALPAENASYGIIAKSADNSFKWHVSVERLNGNGNVNIAANIDNVAQASTNLPTQLAIDTWYNVTVTYNNNTDRKLRIYINGAEAPYFVNTAMTGTYSTDGDNNLKLGSYSNDQGFFNGNIDDVRIFTRQLSPVEANNLYNSAPKPVAYWPANENTGYTINDASDNNNNSYEFTSSDILWIPSSFGTALQFEGTDDNIQIPETPATNIGVTSDSNTVSAWIKTAADYSGNATILAKDDGTGAYPFNLYLNSSEYACFQISDGTNAPSVCSSTALNDGKWHYVAGIRDVVADVIYVSVDGVSINSAADTTTTTTANDDNVSIGNSGSTYTANDFTGAIDEIRIFNYARTTKHILEDMNGGHPVAGSPIGTEIIQWEFDEQTGSTIHNSISTQAALVGTLSGPVWRLSNTCKINGCLYFDTTTDELSAGDTAFTDSLNGMSISFWLKPATLATSRMIVSKANTATERSFAIQTDATTSSELNFYIASSTTDTSNYYTTSGLGLANDTWSHLVFVYDGTQAAADRVKVYKDGKLVAGSITGTLPTTLTAASTSNLKIGRGDDTSISALDAYIDDFKIYNSSLTDAEQKVDTAGGAAASMGGVLNNADNEGFGGNPPVGWWKMDENTGSTYADSSGTTNDSVSSSAVTWAIGRVGTATSYAGSSYIEVADTSTLEFATGDFTISTWVFPTSGADKGVLAKGNGGLATNTEYALNINGAGFYFRGAWRDSAALDATLNQWKHITVVFTDSDDTLHIYNDGAIAATITSVTGSYATDVTNNFVIGAQGTGHTNGFIGRIDDVKVYNRALTAGQVAYDFNRGAPVAHYDMDECNGATIHNSAINGNRTQVSALNGTFTLGAGDQTIMGDCTTSATTPWYTGRTGKFAASLSFDGDDDYVTVADNAAVEFAGPFSVSFWLKSAQTGAAVLIDKDGTSGYSVQRETDNTLKMVVGGATTALRTTSTYSDDTWHHVVFVYRGVSDGNVYVDGRLNEGTLDPGTPSYSTGALVIGSNSGASAYLGLLDSVQLYNYALTQAQAQRLHNEGGSVRFGPNNQ